MRFGAARASGRRGHEGGCAAIMSPKRALDRDAEELDGVARAGGNRLALPSLYAYLMHMEIEWDSDKADSNLEKHGVRFEEAATALLDPMALA